ncbi:hypothetical protein L1887_63055 [Cichorium endivia]|nr:hypothetical protein L1887_63055 [Cichorium endivia]
MFSVRALPRHRHVHGNMKTSECSRFTSFWQLRSVRIPETALLAFRANAKSQHSFSTADDRPIHCVSIDAVILRSFWLRMLPNDERGGLVAIRLPGPPLAGRVFVKRAFAQLGSAIKKPQKVSNFIKLLSLSMKYELLLLCSQGGPAGLHGTVIKRRVFFISVALTERGKERERAICGQADACPEVHDSVHRQECDAFRVLELPPR